ncbi:hypothetical protein [Actinomadura rayongensis]|uniref:Uncharacterized protein n=1 Tax=Actinomadura rayongensis TaxID=1429076 RepID=A0A6I4W3U2_9ACTN|nr:hypothetical protein [Actinomadura rayongensis]MXQ64088.1 hypothetical protein [Actinomadura rayongensis]
MTSTLVYAFLAGLLGANGFPHFVKGISKEEFANPFSTAPIVNLLLGWPLLVIAVYLGGLAHIGAHPVAALAAGAVGVLLAGVFHAQVGALGKKPEPARER